MYLKQTLNKNILMFVYLYGPKNNINFFCYHNFSDLY